MASARLSERATLVARAAIVAIGAWVLYSGLLKLQGPSDFESLLLRQGLVGARTARVASIALPALETIVGASVIAGVVALGRWRTSAAMALAMFTAFTAYAVALSIRPPPAPVPCGCGFGQAPVERWAGIATRNAAIVVGLGACLLVPRARAGPVPPPLAEAAG